MSLHVDALISARHSVADVELGKRQLSVSLWEPNRPESSMSDSA